MSAEDSKEKKPIHGGRNLVLLGIGAITIALITTSISLYFYGKGDIYIDRSRPGYISEDEVHQTDEDYQEKYSDEGNVDGSEELNSAAQGFEKIKSKAENVQRLRDADDETYRTYIWSLLNGLLDENSDYRTQEDGQLIFISPENKAIIVEQVFNLPGLGRLLLAAISRRDFPLLSGIVFYLAFITVLLYFLSDIAAAVSDPRIRLK